MREANICDGKERITGFDCFNSDVSCFDESMTRDDFFHDVHRTLLRFECRRLYLAGETRLVIIKETAVFDNRFRDSVKPACELFQRNLLTATDTFNEAEVSGSQQPYVLRVLPVNFFDGLRDDKL